MERLKKYKSIIQEMAYPRKKIEEEIRSSNRNRREHLILIYFLSNNNAKNHWQSEVYADIKDISDMKWRVNNKYLSKEEYFSNLWSMPYEDGGAYSIIDSTIEDLIEENYNIPNNWKEKKMKLVKNMKDFYEKISYLLSTGSVSKKVIYSLLDNFK